MSAGAWPQPQREWNRLIGDLSKTNLITSLDRAARRFARKTAERIAARWADHRKVVPQIAFKPDWTKHAKAAPFKRNDQMLDVLPIGVLVFPGTGIQENLADKARKRVSATSPTSHLMYALNSFAQL